MAGLSLKRCSTISFFSIDNQYQPIPRWYIELGKYKIAEDARYTLTDPRKSVFDNAATLTPIGKWDNKLFFSARANKQNYLFYYDLKEKKSNNIQISYPENSFAIPEEHSFIPKCMSDDGKYLISYEIQENDENPVIILAEKSGYSLQRLYPDSLSFQHIFVLKPIE